MSTAEIMSIYSERFDALDVARRLGPLFAKRATQCDESDEFVAENYADLKASGLVEAAVPRELGGHGAEIAALCGMIREIGRHCGSTALAFSMHTHQVAIPAWRWRYQKATPTEPLLKRIASERIIVLSSGGSDWIAGSGKAERVDGGFRITARKIFSSGSPAGDLLMTGAVFDDPETGPTVLHFGVPMNSPRVSILPTWKTLGMRGTASNDVMIDGHIVPEAGVAAKRKAGEWAPLFHIITMIAFPLIYSAYLGVAERARDLAVEMAKRRANGHVVGLAGQMATELRCAQYAHAAMISAAERGAPGPETTNEIMIGRALVARHAIKAVELAMEVAGGSAFYRDNGLERCFRDIQGARYHPMQSGPQQEFAGRVALGMDTLTTY